MTPTRNKFTILKQVMEKIPSYIVGKVTKPASPERPEASRKRLT